MAYNNSIDLPSHVIDDATSVRSILSDASQMGMSRGYIERETPYGEGVGAAFNLPLIPESEWKDRIEEREAKGLTNRALRKHVGLQSLDQNGSNYCWCNGVTQAMHYAQVKSGETLQLLSPASVAAPIKGFRNQGGWGDQALEYMAENGINLQSDWPPNAIDRRYYTTENREKAKLNRAMEWFDLQPRNFNEAVTCLLNGIPYGAARNWWGHLTCDIDVTVQHGEVVIITDNSWGASWGDKGLGVISGTKKLCDEMVAPRVRMATGGES